MSGKRLTFGGAPVSKPSNEKSLLVDLSDSETESEDDSFSSEEIKELEMELQKVLNDQKEETNPSNWDKLEIVSYRVKENVYESSSDSELEKNEDEQFKEALRNCSGIVAGGLVLKNITIKPEQCKGEQKTAKQGTTGIMIGSSVKRKTNSGDDEHVTVKKKKRNAKVSSHGMKTRSQNKLLPEVFAQLNTNNSQTLCGGILGNVNATPGYDDVGS